jgi:hypothetical protein
MRGLKTTAGILLASAAMASAQFATNWVAFNDHNRSGMPAPMTGTNVTLYHLGSWTGGVFSVTGSGGPLTNYFNGQELAATLLVTATTSDGSGPDDFGASNDPNMGTPAYNLFNGIVDVGGSVATGTPGSDEGIIGLRVSDMNVVTLTFSNLDTSQRYLFRGTSVRGNNYVDRWAMYEIHAASSVDAHVDGSGTNNIFTADTFPAAGLTAGQVVLNSGENRVGSLVGWNDIVPNPDGTFSITEQQWAGATPFGNAAAGAAAAYGYGMNAIMLAEIFTGPPSAPSIVVQPAGVTNSEGQVARLQVIATGTPPLTYQWYSGTPPSGVAIVGATRATYSVTNTAGSGKGWSVPSDSGDYYVVVTGALAPPATSSKAKVLVHADTNPPVFLYATCDATDPHVVTLFLSEPVDNSDGRVTETFNWAITDVPGGGDLAVTAIEYIPGSTTITFTNFLPRDPNLTYQITESGQPLFDRSVAQNTMPDPSSILINCIETELIALNANWRYLDNDIDPGPTWFQSGFVDSGWALGAGVFDAKTNAFGIAGQNCRDTTFYNLGAVGTCINMISPITMTNLITAYFRTHFNFGGDPTNAILQSNGKFDDGAIVYLNGVELGRVGVPAAPAVVGHNTFASRTAGDGDAQDIVQFVFPPSLHNGDNVLAVALHQQALTSSDLTMGLRLVAQTRTPLTVAGPRMTITLEGANVRIKWTPANGQLQFTDVLNNAPTWQDQTTGQVGPGEYVIPHSQLRRFYSLRQ